MIPVNIVTGFLGSGKTTLLKEILRHPDFADAAVIVNEFGEVGLDHLLLEGVEEGVLLLENGCICCTIRSDLKETIRDLHDRATSGRIPRFSRVVIETTGIADPAPIVSTIAAEPIIRNHYRLGNIICTVDAITGQQSLHRQPECTKQVAVADRLLLTKTDLVDEATCTALEGELRSLNALASFGRSVGRGFDSQLLFAEDLGGARQREAEVVRWLRAAGELADKRVTQAASGAHGHGHGNVHGHSHAQHPDASGAIASFTLTYEQPIDWTAFGVWLTALLHAHGERILRVKGLLHVQESTTPVVIHGVQHVVHAPMHLERWPDDDRRSRIVFITRGMSEARVRRSLEVFLAATGNPSAVEPVLKEA